MGDVTRLTGVYHADGGLVGELRYAVGKLRGSAHCGLCDVTHSGVRAKREWAAYVGGLTVPFGLVHLNERSAEVAAASEGRTPCVLAHTAGGAPVLVLDAAALDATGGDVGAFARALEEALRRHGLALP